MSNGNVDRYLSVLYELVKTGAYVFRNYYKQEKLELYLLFLEEKNMADAYKRQVHTRQKSWVHILG